MKIILISMAATGEDQNLDRQLNTLKECNCEKIFMEKASGKNTNRPELKAMMNYIREGDTVHITSISRIARSTKDFLKIIEDHRRSSKEQS